MRGLISGEKCEKARSEGPNRPAPQYVNNRQHEGRERKIDSLLGKLLRASPEHAKDKGTTGQAGVQRSPSKALVLYHDRRVTKFIAIQLRELLKLCSKRRAGRVLCILRCPRIRLTCVGYNVWRRQRQRRVLNILGEFCREAEVLIFVVGNAGFLGHICQRVSPPSPVKRNITP